MLNLGNEQLITPPTSNMQAELSRVNSEENLKSKSFKLMKGRNGRTAFLPLSSKIGGLINNNKPSIGTIFNNRTGQLWFTRRQSQVR